MLAIAVGSVRANFRKLLGMVFCGRADFFRACEQPYSLDCHGAPLDSSPIAFDIIVAETGQEIVRLSVRTGLQTRPVAMGGFGAWFPSTELTT